MYNVPIELKYTNTHTWVEDIGDGQYRIGITDFAQEQLGDVVYVELPEVGMDVTAEQDIALVESVKSASDIPAPLSGKVTEVNSELEDAPETINEDPYGEAWLFKLEIADAAAINALMDAEAYSDVLE